LPVCSRRRAAGFAVEQAVGAEVHVELRLAQHAEFLAPAIASGRSHWAQTMRPMTVSRTWIECRANQPPGNMTEVTTK